jgi:hypothetical protein
VDDTLKKNARNLLMSAECDIRAAKHMLRVTTQDQTESLMCNITHAMAKCKETCELIAPEELQAQMRDIEQHLDMLSHQDEDENQERLEFDPVAITPNGCMPSKEDHGS